MFQCFQLFNIFPKKTAGTRNKPIHLGRLLPAPNSSGHILLKKGEEDAIKNKKIYIFMERNGVREDKDGRVDLLHLMHVRVRYGPNDTLGFYLR